MNRFGKVFPFVLALALMLTGASISQAQSFDPEQVIRTYFGAAATLDVDTTVALFAPEGVIEDPVGTPAHRGHKAIREHLQTLTAPFTGIDFDIHRIWIVSPTEAASSWTATIHTRAGQSIAIEGLGTFVFNDDGQIRSVREYWELADLLGQL
jgi:steroid delta-isomerase